MSDADKRITRSQAVLSDVSEDKEEMDSPEFGSILRQGGILDRDSADCPINSKLPVVNPGQESSELVMETLAKLTDMVMPITQGLPGLVARVEAIELGLRRSVPGAVQTPSGQPVPCHAHEEHAVLSGLDSCVGMRAEVPATGRHFAKPQEFDGSSQWPVFRAQFEAIASLHGWNDNDRLGELVACLKGPALQLFAHLPDPDKGDYGRLTDALDGRFGAANQELRFRSQLRRRVRSAGESLPTLAQDIERLVFLSYPTAPQELKDSLACDHFLDALHDVELTIAVRQGRPTRLACALSSAIEIESIRLAAGASCSPTPYNSGTVCRGSDSQQGVNVRKADSSYVAASADGQAVELARELRDVWREIVELKDRLSSSFPTGGQTRGPGAAPTKGRRPTMVCWDCNGVGHLRRNCPARPLRQVPSDVPAGSEN